MNSITQNHQDEELLSKKMQVFFRRYQVSRILRAANAYKLRGIPVLSSTRTRLNRSRERNSSGTVETISNPRKYLFSLMV